MRVLRRLSASAPPNSLANDMPLASGTVGNRVASVLRDDEVSSEGAWLGHAAVLIWNDVAPEGRAQFYEWHDKEHIPERIALPGFRRGRRLRKPGHSPEWLTIYEADDVSALVSPQYLARLNAPTPATAATLKYFHNTSRAVCRLVRSIGSSTGGYMLAVRLDVAAANAEAMRKYLQRDAFPRLTARRGVVAAHLLAADMSASYVSTAESSTRTFDVPGWVLLFEASTSDAASEAVAAIDQEALTRLGVRIRDHFPVYALEVSRLSR